MKIGIIGLGGIGTKFCKNIHTFIELGQVDTDIEFHIFDSDSVEMKNLRTGQVYNPKDIGENKAIATSKKYPLTFIPHNEKIEYKIEQLDKYDFDLIIICADNWLVRTLIYEWCYDNEKNFLDLRCEGRNICCLEKSGERDEDFALLGKGDENESIGCQRKEDLKNEIIQAGYLVASSLGIQMLLNILRNEKFRNKKIIMRI